MTWEVFKKAFLDRLFARENREDKVVEFINIYQVCMSVLKYNLKSTQLSKYSPFLVYDPRDEMKHFVTRLWMTCNRNFIR